MSTTESKSVKEPHGRSEEFFRNLIECSAQGVLVHRDDKPIYVNPAWAELHGYSVDEVLALDSVVPLITPHDRDRMAKYGEMRRRGADPPCLYEYQAIRRDGSTVWFENLVTVGLWNREPAIQSFIVDISERKRVEMALRQSEQRFQDLASASGADPIQ